MIEKKIDRRVRRTQKLLGDALVSLILERGYEHITIKDITERADVAYVTFFRNYHSIDDLLKQQLETVVEEFTERVIAAAETEVMGGADEGRMIFEFVQQNHRLYRILLTSPGAFHVTKHLQKAIARKVFTGCDDFFKDDLAGTLPFDVTANHVAAGLLALIDWWLANDMPYDPAEMGQFYDKLVVQATLNTLRQEVDAPAPA